MPIIICCISTLKCIIQSPFLRGQARLLHTCNGNYGRTVTLGQLSHVTVVTCHKKHCGWLFVQTIPVKKRLTVIVILSKFSQKQLFLYKSLNRKKFQNSLKQQ